MQTLAHHVDVAVIGAGPAGCAAARVLAQQGCHVQLLDQVGTFEKPGQCLSAAARTLLQELDLLDWIERSAPNNSAQGFSSWGQEALQVCQFMHGAYAGGWLLDRRRFDTCLRAAAIDAGAEFHPNRVLQLQAVDDGWRLTLQQGKSTPQQVHAAWLLDASGRRSLCAQQLELTRSNDESLIALYACGHDLVQDGRNVIEAVPQGWWMSGPLPGGRRVAALHVCAEEASAILRECGRWRQMLEQTRHLRQLCPDDGHWSTPHGCDASASRLSRVYGSNWLACGDAALTFDPLATQGIVAALHGGTRCAQALLAARGGDNSALPLYAQWLADLHHSGRQQLLAHYRSEQRWPQQPFWACRHQASA